MSEDLEALRDSEHLRLLRIAYFVSGGANAFWALFPLIHVTMGLFLIFAPFAVSEAGEARFVGIMFVVIGAMVSLILAVIGALKLLTARALGLRRSRVLCLVTAAITCFGLPYGTAIGVATFLVLSRPRVVAWFEGSPEPA